MPNKTLKIFSLGFLVWLAACGGNSRDVNDLLFSPSGSSVVDPAASPGVATLEICGTFSAEATTEDRCQVDFENRVLALTVAPDFRFVEMINLNNESVATAAIDNLNAGISRVVGDSCYYQFAIGPWYEAADWGLWGFQPFFDVICDNCWFRWVATESEACSTARVVPPAAPTN